MEQGLEALVAGFRQRLIADQAIVTAGQARMVDTIAACAEAGAFSADGATDLTSWVMATLNVPYPQASDLVGLARRLKDLPELAKSFAQGNIPIEAAGAAAKLATPETDAFFTEVAESTPAKELVRAVKHKESLEAQQADPAPRPMLHWSPTADGWYRITGFLPPDAGATLVAALKRAEDRTDGPNPETGSWDPAETKAANALIELAETALGNDRDKERATVNVHVDIRALVTGEGSGELAAGGVITAETVRKLACARKVRWIIRDEHGLVGVGSSDHDLPASLLTYVKARDGGCRFPGCGRSRHLHAHHIIHWANGGPTNVANMTLLCNRHHALVHEGGWSIEGSPEPGPGVGDTLRFLRPDGSVFVPHPLVAAVPSAGEEQIPPVRSAGEDPPPPVRSAGEDPPPPVRSAGDGPAPPDVGSAERLL
ncbi:MAG TPA: DUF222 domain-containing protein [Streptosporangiaceae bacterium]|nr:DUF222 domain-containing protein [Streptosporangiaceae bacterium]